MASHSPNGKPRRRIKKLRLAILLTVLGLLASASFTFGLVRAIAAEIPSLDPSRQPQEDGFIYASDGKRILAVLRGAESRKVVGSEDIHPLMKQAIVAIEDRRFYEHHGVDVRGIARALWADITQQAVVQGGSTITQQFVKNSYLRGGGIARKLKEAALAWQLEQQWDSKDRILTAYLNTIYFGNGAYGVERAARSYFDKSAKELQLAEAALLAAIPKDPSRFNPVTNPGAARKRRDLVLAQMFEQGMISTAEYERALRAPLPNPDEVRLPGTVSPGAPLYFVNYVKQQLVDRYGAAVTFGAEGGLHVTTSIDLRIQQFARDAISKWLVDPEGPSAALVALDPNDGRVLAMIGGNNFRESEFNLAVQGERQPGSAFKPFVLATALEHGVAPATRFVSKPTTIFLGDRLWTVSNYEDAYLGSIDLESATIHSDNAVYAQLTALLGPANVVRTAKRLGIASPLRNYFSIGLGAQAVNPLEMARAFASFANGGRRIDTSLFGNAPRAIVSVGTSPRRQEENVPRLRPYLSSRTSAVINSLLQKVVQQGTGRRAALPDGRPAAGKTGTTEHYGDAWFVGYTPQVVAAVWVGFPHELRPMLTEFHGEPVAGGTYPALIWKSFMERTLRYLKAEPLGFAEPPYPYASAKYVVQREGKLQLDNGYCRGARQVFYFTGGGPRRTANCLPNEVEVPDVVGQTIGEAREQLAAQPLTPSLIYKPARPRQRLGIVLKQWPRKGRRSSYDKVTLVLAKPLHGVVPRLVGLTLRQARARLRDRELQPAVAGFADGPAGRIVAQSPLGGVAAAPGMTVSLVVARG